MIAEDNYKPIIQYGNVEVQTSDGSRVPGTPARIVGKNLGVIFDNCTFVGATVPRAPVTEGEKK